MTPMDVGPMRPFNVGVLRLNQSITLRSHTLSRGTMQHFIVCGICPDDTKHAFHWKIGDDIRFLFKRGRVIGLWRLRSGGEVFPHPLIPEIVRIMPADFITQPFKYTSSDVEMNPSMRGAIGQET